MNSDSRKPGPNRGPARFILLGVLVIVMTSTIVAAARGQLPLPVPPQGDRATASRPENPGHDAGRDGDTANGQADSGNADGGHADDGNAAPASDPERGTDDAPAPTGPFQPEVTTTQAQALPIESETTAATADRSRVRYLLSENNDIADSEARPDASGTWTQWAPGISTPYLLDVRLPDFDPAKPLNGITVILDPGHGGKDPGTAGFDGGGNEHPEKVFNYNVAQRVIPMLEAQGAQVIPTRTGDEWVSLYSRIAIAGQYATSIWQALLEQTAADTAWIGAIEGGFQVMRSINEDTAGSGGRGMAQGVGMNEAMRKALDMQLQLTNTIYLSIHANASNDSSVRGYQVYYTPSDAVYAAEGERVRTQPDGEDTKPISPFYAHYDNDGRRALAEALAQALGESVPELNKHPQPVTSGNYAYLREVGYNAVMIEAGFMSNPSDLALLLDESVQQRLAEGIIRGLAAYAEALAS
ncbi:MAG: N-acetylmuramoyl-L-alanine amidase [Bacillota bacterium]|nr:N-acetylmuramoyl-L-alanine amidase [Bacillota bacterium]